MAGRKIGVTVVVEFLIATDESAFDLDGSDLPEAQVKKLVASHYQRADLEELLDDHEASSQKVLKVVVG